MRPLLTARGLCAGYGGTTVVRDVDIDVHEGEVVALLGANGAGKTTTLLTLSGDHPASEGEVLLFGQPTKAPLSVRASQGLAMVPEDRSVFSGLTVRENLRVSRSDQDQALELFPELVSLIDRKAGLLSGGEQQILSLARALSRSPRLLLADELSLGLAPKIVNRLIEAVSDAAVNRGVGVLLVEQHAQQALRVADRVLVLRRGRIVLNMTAEEVSKDLSLLEDSYLTGG
ncbi:ABC transporter ATP-binding protein [Candidatus Poriferisocius sp.]|uniref:ABC transporter ATP-binding protein n=1 Tax=Candidatus Poriferisocius sp. TaxID=3101276 RepID=UPI003B011ADF